MISSISLFSFDIFGFGDFIISKNPAYGHFFHRTHVNIHMGISPYYRGSSCNFWASYDGHPELVGATIHMLSRGLDSGDILYHALPKPEKIDVFTLGMKSVKVTHDSLVERIGNGEIFGYQGIPQDRTKEYRYTRNKEFTDEVAKKYIKD